VTEPARPDPSAWLVGHQGDLPPDGDVLEVACGRGRNALWLARRGLKTTAVDRDAEAIATLDALARRDSLPLAARVVDLEGPRLSLGHAAFDLIVVTHYLHRPLFPALRTALRPGGVLIYETFTRAQALRGQPTNPAFLLEPGELVRLVSPLQVVDAREGDFEGRMVASVVALKRGRSAPWPSRRQ
jgi:tellurite methyltransferase